MQRSLDSFMDGLEKNPSAVISGNPREAMRIIKEARRLWSMKSRAEIIERAINRAKLSAPAQKGSMGLALRNEFRKIGQNEDMMATFSPKERTAILKVVEADRPEKYLGLLARYSPENRPLLLLMAIGGTAGAFTLDARSAALAAPTVVGQVAQTAINRKIEREAQRASGITRGGRKPHRYSLPLTLFQTGNMATRGPGGGGF